MLIGIGASAHAAMGPSSSQSPYLVPQAAGVEFTSILTVGDEVRKKHKGNETYRMAGIPDGLGAYVNGVSLDAELVEGGQLLMMKAPR